MSFRIPHTPIGTTLNCLSMSVANGGKAFIFGDTKQSIYRWNDGDAGIMSLEIDKARGTDKVNEERPLKYNFRTYENIIRFNNALFSSLYDATATQQPGSEDQKDKGSVSMDVSIQILRQ